MSCRPQGEHLLLRGTLSSCRHRGLIAGLTRDLRDLLSGKEILTIHSISTLYPTANDYSRLQTLVHRLSLDRVFIFAA
jgi:hypothetical protein